MRVQRLDARRLSKVDELDDVLAAGKAGPAAANEDAVTATAPLAATLGTPARPPWLRPWLRPWVARHGIGGLIKRHSAARRSAACG